MKIVKNLSVVNISKFEGFIRREDLDFADDGKYFKGFSYIRKDGFYLSQLSKAIA